MTIWTILKAIFPLLGWILFFFMCKICYEQEEKIKSLKKFLLLMPLHISAEIMKENKEDEKNNEAQ